MPAAASRRRCRVGQRLLHVPGAAVPGGRCGHHRLQPPCRGRLPLPAAHCLQVRSPCLHEPLCPKGSMPCHSGVHNATLPSSAVFSPGILIHLTCFVRKTEVLRQYGVCVCRGELLTGCVSVNGVDKCFTGDLASGPSTCAKAQGGYNLTSFAALLAAGKGADGREGSLCDPKVRPRHTCYSIPVQSLQGLTRLRAVQRSRGCVVLGNAMDWKSLERQ